MFDKFNSVVDKIRAVSEKIKNVSKFIKYLSSVVDHFATCFSTIPRFEDGQEVQRSEGDWRRF